MPRKPVTAALFEASTPLRRSITQGLSRAGLEVSAAEGPDALRKEGLLVVGPSAKDGAKLAKAARAQRPGLIVLAAQKKDGPARWADGVLPLPLSPRDLKARLPELSARAQPKPPPPAPKPEAEGVEEGGPPLDPRTGFWNFSAFRDLLFVEVKRARRYGFPLAVAMMAFDPLPIPKTPELRTQLMGGLALAVRRSLRDTDFPVQYGERRVLVLMPHTPLQGSVVVTRRICDRVARAQLPLGNQVLDPTLSIGLSAYSPGQRELSFAELVRQANGCLQSAMRNGGNRVEFYDLAERIARDDVAS